MSTTFMNKPKNEPEPQLQKEGEVLIGLDERLANLMEMGWTLVAESCSIESCRCPLLRSLDGNKYCVNCESWIFDKERKKQQFTSLVVRGPQEVQLKKEQAIAKRGRSMVDFNYNVKENILNALRIKLAYLSSILNETTDLDKTAMILKNIKLCIKDMKKVNESI